MKSYTVKYAYSGNGIESTMTINANSAAEAESEAMNYCDRVISVHEDAQTLTEKEVMNAAWNWFILQWDAARERLESARASGEYTEVAEARERRAWDRLKTIESMIRDN